MKYIHGVWVGSFVLGLGLISPATATTANTVATSIDACEGCTGDADAGSGNGAGDCAGEQVTISLTVESSPCEVQVVEPLGIECWGTYPCTVTVVRTWSGLPPNSDVEMCHSMGASGSQFQVKRCISPTPSSGSGGSGQDTKEVPLPCGSSGTFSITSACGTTASASTTCENNCE